jgi:hypothetical protein
VAAQGRPARLHPVGGLLHRAHRPREAPAPLDDVPDGPRRLRGVQAVRGRPLPLRSAHPGRERLGAGGPRLSADPAVHPGPHREVRRRAGALPPAVGRAEGLLRPRFLHPGRRGAEGRPQKVRGSNPGIYSGNRYLAALTKFMRWARDHDRTRNSADLRVHQVREPKKKTSKRPVERSVWQAAGKKLDRTPDAGRVRHPVQGGKTDSG